jgi:hypothetical protein
MSRYLVFQIMARFLSLFLGRVAGQGQIYGHFQFSVGKGFDEVCMRLGKLGPPQQWFPRIGGEKDNWDVAEITYLLGGFDTIQAPSQLNIHQDGVGRGLPGSEHSLFTGGCHRADPKAHLFQSGPQIYGYQVFILYNQNIGSRHCKVPLKITV